jgi:hypothetical protein
VYQLVYCHALFHTLLIPVPRTHVHTPHIHTTHTPTQRIRNTHGVSAPAEAARLHQLLLRQLFLTVADGLSAAGGGIASGGGDSSTATATGTGTGTGTAAATGLASFAALMWTVRTFTVPGVQRVISRFLTPADMVQYGRMFSEGGVFMCTARNVRSLMSEGTALKIRPIKTDHVDVSLASWLKMSHTLSTRFPLMLCATTQSHKYRPRAACGARSAPDSLPLAHVVCRAGSTWPTPLTPCAFTDGLGKCHSRAEVIELHISHHTSHYTLYTAHCNF